MGTRDGRHPAEGEDTRAIVTIERAAEQPANKRQYQNEYDQSEHCKLLSQRSAAIHAVMIKKRGFHHGVCRIKVSPVTLSRVINHRIDGGGSAVRGWLLPFNTVIR